MAFTESDDPKTQVSVTFKANCSMGHFPKDYAEFIQKVFTFYYPQHHVHDVVVTPLGETETPSAPVARKAAAKPAPVVVDLDEDLS